METGWTTIWRGASAQSDAERDVFVLLVRTEQGLGFAQLIDVAFTRMNCVCYIDGAVRGCGTL